MEYKHITPITHELKFKGENLCQAVYDGRKPYEIRKNDRDFRVGDFIHPISVDDSENKIHHPIDNCLYEITYVSDNWPVALKEGYCVFGIKHVGDVSENYRGNP